MPKPRRIRDPIHDLIEFGVDDFEQMAWSLLETKEFQRLRRIRQLGFSELVFPGATRSRFAHSVGVFHTARQLANHIERKHGKNQDRSEVAMAAALVHDVGHGPFSHAFEAAGKKFHRSQKHELWTVDIIQGDTEVGKVLDGFKPGFRDQVAQIIADKMPQDIYGSIVSSQFDADRLDYVRRDRFMAGVHHGEFDFSWLMANLEVDQIPLAIDDDQIGIVPGLLLGRKAFQAAEAYVLGLFHLYFAVYFHKTTRSAEKMLTGLLLRIGELFHDGKSQDCGLSQDHPLLSFISSGTVGDYLKLDDFVLWAAFQEMLKAKDSVVSALARRLLHRKPYKAIEISAHFEHRGGDAAVATFKGRLNAAQRAGEIGPTEVFSDTASRTPYKKESFETPAALSKVLIRRADGTGIQDLRDSSSVVRALEETSVYRLYVRDEEAKAKVEKLMEGI